jgi:hypothetical protein
VTLEDARAKRIIVAVLQNIQNWESRVMDAERTAAPGSKYGLLALARDMEFARRSLCRLSGMDGVSPCPPPLEAPAVPPTEGWSGDKPPDE